mgnify:CR=1 FL=1
MSNKTQNWIKISRFYVRVYLKGPKCDTYRTLGPYGEEKAKKLAEGYLSQGICSWVEEID